MKKLKGEGEVMQENVLVFIKNFKRIKKKKKFVNRIQPNYA